MDGGAGGPLSSPPSMNELSLRDIALERGERRIAAGISVHVPEGQALLLHGANGSGKSTLLRVLAGLLPAAAGQVLWNGADVAKDRETFRQRFLYLGHQDGLKPGLTALENLQFWARYAGGSDPEAALRAFDLTALADRPVRVLSAGQKRRVALCRLALRPVPLWLLDEPLTALDDQAREAFLTRLERHLETGIAVIATHHAVPVDSIVLPIGGPTGRREAA